MSSWTHVSSLSNSFEFKLVLHLLFNSRGRCILDSAPPSNLFSELCQDETDH